LDVLESDESCVAEALAYPEHSSTGTRIIARPFLVILKMTASRAQDLADIQRMLGQAGDTALDQVRMVVRRFRPEDAGDIEHLIALGKPEYE
jgi:hypothetical protein